MRGIDGTIRIRAREQGERWPNNALCDLSLASCKGPSVAVFLAEDDVRVLIVRLQEQLVSSASGTDASPVPDHEVALEARIRDYGSDVELGADDVDSLFENEERV